MRTGEPIARAVASRRARPHGFTLIELLVVLAIVALLAAIAAPRYFQSLERAREATLRSSLSVMRDAIDQFVADKDRYPDGLDELVRRGYLQAVPVDPFMQDATSWVTVSPPADDGREGRVWDVHSGAAAQASDGRPFSEW